MTRKRNVHIQFWLSSPEATDFNRRVRRSGLSREAYLRQIIKGLRPQDTPPPDFYTLTNELRRIGVNLNQLAARANTTDHIDGDWLTKVLGELEDTLRAVSNETLSPKHYEPFEQVIQPCQQDGAYLGKHATYTNN